MAPDLDPHCLPLPIYKSILSANTCSKGLSRYGFLPAQVHKFYQFIIILKALITAKSSGFIGC